MGENSIKIYAERPHSFLKWEANFIMRYTYHQFDISHLSILAKPSSQYCYHLNKQLKNNLLLQTEEFFNS